MAQSGTASQTACLLGEMPEHGALGDTDRLGQIARGDADGIALRRKLQRRFDHAGLPQVRGQSGAC